MSRQRRPRQKKRKWAPRTALNSRGNPMFGYYDDRNHVCCAEPCGTQPECPHDSLCGKYRGGPCQRDRILDRISDPIFGSYPATLFSQQRAYKLANVSHTLVSKVETIAVCERERVAHVCCAALAQCMPVHAHCGAHACSVPQEERKSQCTICQSCNLKLPRRCQSNTQFCALCRFGRQTWTWEGACAYGLFATL